MICIKSEYFSLNRILLLAIGLWPYERPRYVQLQIILSLCLLISFAVVQLTVFITTECNLDLIIKIFSIITFSLFYTIHYIAFWINANNVRCLLGKIQQICNELRNENEIAIIKQYGNNTKRFTIIITMFAAGCLLTFILSPIWPQILNVILHINGSQPRSSLKILTEYFIDQERYFYLILLHINVVTCIGMITITATGTMLRGCIKHVCGMFRIASYRIEQAMMIKILENVRSRNEILNYQEIICAVDIHRKAMRISEYLLSSFKEMFATSMGIHVISLSLNIFGIFRNMSLGSEEELMMHLAIVVSILIYMFLANYAGQELTDHNNDIFFTVYNTQWYIAPLHSQRLLLFMLQRGNKAFTLNIGIFEISLQCFATLLKASMSYFTVIYSTQQ